MENGGIEHARLWLPIKSINMCFRFMMLRYILGFRSCALGLAAAFQQPLSMLYAFINIFYNDQVPF